MNARLRFSVLVLGVLTVLFPGCTQDRPPATPPAATQPGGTVVKKRVPPGTQPAKPGPITGLRARQLKADIDKFRLSIWRMEKVGDKHVNLTLTVSKEPRELAGSPFGGYRHKKEDEVRTVVRIDKELAAKIIDHLVTEGFLSRARNVFDAPMEPCAYPGVTMSVSGPDKVIYFDELQWGLPMLDRLTALRKVLKNAGRAEGRMDEFIAPLRLHRKDWRKAAGLDAELPGSRLSIADGIAVAMRQKGALWVAVCKATDKAGLAVEEVGGFAAGQRLRVVETLAGSGQKDDFWLCYDIADNPGLWERPILRGEQVIWIMRLEDRRWSGIKALSDTPENRKGVAEAAKAAAVITKETIQEMTRRLASGGITKNEAIQIANAAYRVLWGEPPGELKVTKCELNNVKTWEVEVWWDLGLPNGGARFWIRQTGSFERAEYLPGE